MANTRQHHARTGEPLSAPLGQEAPNAPDVQMADQDPPVSGESSNTLNDPTIVSTDVPLEERIRVAREKRDRLLQERELVALEGEIRNLETGIEDTNSPEQVQHVERAVESPVTPPVLAPPPQSSSKGLRPKSPRRFAGRSLHAYRQFVRECEIAFHLSPHNFADSGTKIMWAMQYLEGDARDAWWTQYDRGILAQGTTWDDFKEFLLNLINDPTHRGLDAATKYANARQQPGQSIRQFATYLESLEQELPTYTDEQRAHHLFAKLREDLRTHITNFHNVPTDRESLISLGSTLEKNVKSSREQRPDRPRESGRDKRISSKERSQERSHPYRRDTPSPRIENSRSAPRAQVRREQEPTCYECKQKGHIRPNCPRLKGPAEGVNSIPVRGSKPSAKDRALRQPRET